MKNEDKIALLLNEMVENIITRLKDKDIYEPTPFYQGYRSGIAIIVKEIEGTFASIMNLTDVELRVFDVDSWYKHGKDFHLELP